MSSVVIAAPRHVRVVIGTKTVDLSSEAFVEDGKVYAPIDILKSMGVNYAEGEHRVTIALSEEVSELNIVERQKTRYIPLEEASKDLDIYYNWDDDSSTVTLLAKLVAVEFEGNTLTARLTMPASVSSARIWPKPWRISLDLPGTKVSTDAKAYSIDGGNLSRIRLGQFTDDTARVVMDIDCKMGFQILTNEPSKEIKVSLGGTANQAKGGLKPQKATPVTITGIKFDRDGNSRVKVRISTTGKPTFATQQYASPARISVDIEKAVLKVAKDDISVDHAALRDIRVGSQNDTAQIVLDTTRYLAYTADADAGGITLDLRLPSGAGGKLKDKLIVIDPGHGGNKPGAQCNGVKEKILNMQIAQKIKSELEQIGARVILTRDGDYDVDLPNRPAIADNHCADFFISIHCNALAPETLSGTETYYHPGQPSSRALAYSIQSRLIASTNMKNRGARLDTKLSPIGLSVLRNANIPAVLIECGFIDNSTDRKLLSDDSFRAKFARGVVDGLRTYVEGTIEVEGN
ncbi:MAG: N-acetylmuramoyl-L-alanine amidase [Armatimonadota bacterium]